MFNVHWQNQQKKHLNQLLVALLFEIPTDIYLGFPNVFNWFKRSALTLKTVLTEK